MRIPLRARTFALAVSLCCGSFVAACPQWTRDLGLDVWNSVGESTKLASYQRESRELNVVSERVKKRLEMKEILVNDLIDDQIDLSEATEQFEGLNEIEPELASYVRMHFEGVDDREKTARQVLCFASTMLAHNPSRQEMVMKRLDLQFKAITGARPIEVIH
jgi:hypothetical protein